MRDENSQTGTNEMLPKGRRIFQQLAFGSLGLSLACIVEELITWNAPPFLIGQGILVVVLGLFWWLLTKGHSLRWLLFGLLLVCGAYTFLLGGLHMKDLQTEAVDPLCYWLVGAGIALLGIGGFSAYSEELDAYFRWLVQQRANKNG
ncbi:MAG: hypothetical protein RLZZ519_2939 [Bacteroidota bacterium]|jgi:hypothetical protein